MGLKLPSVRRYKKQMTKYASADFKHDRSLLPFGTARTFYNFDFSSGVLRKGYGVKQHPCVPVGAQRYWIYRLYSEEHGEYADQYIYQYSNGLLAWFDAFKHKEIYVSGLPYGPLDIINYRVNSKDVLLLTCEGRKLITWDGDRYVEYANSPAISSMAIHYERLFVTSRDEKTKVYFSKNLDPTQWEISEDGGGFIELLDERGYMNKVVSFGNYLYIFRDHGISRVTAYGDQTEFSVVNMFVTAGRIFPSGITTCGNCIMFLASDGLYRFDGYECVRVLTDISAAILPDDNCACAYYDGKYYLACKMDFGDGKTVGCESSDEYKTNALIVYDLSSGEYSVSRGLDIRFMNACSYNGEDYLMCCEGGKGGVIERGAARFDDPLPSYWESGVTDMSAPDRAKYVTEILFDNTDGGSADNIELGVCADGVWSKLNVQSAAANGVKLNVSGHRFAFSLYTDSDTVNATPLCVRYNTY
ncbi:MAG: hypothetical protein K2M47_07260 [Clostridiales bacterium]|nr:hypothetical protein [Clostridiales bacterium]